MTSISIHSKAVLSFAVFPLPQGKCWEDTIRIQIPKAVGSSAAWCLQMETCLSHNNATESSYHNCHRPLCTALMKQQILPLPTILKKQKQTLL